MHSMVMIGFQACVKMNSPFHFHSNCYGHSPVFDTVISQIPHVQDVQSSVEGKRIRESTLCLIEPGSAYLACRVFVMFTVY